MKILFIGDVVGKSGRLAVKEQLPLLKEKYNPDLVIINGENAAHGKGITPKIFRELLSYGGDVITLGNHSYAKRAIEEIIEDEKLVSPINYQMYEKGSGIRYVEVCGQRVGIINVLGAVFMDREVENPYEKVKGVLNEEGTLYFVDFHGEATGEKAIFANVYKDSLIACVGTHTHVQTADECIMDGCAFISDVGMCGAQNSVLGRSTEEVVHQALTGEKTHYTIAEGPYIFCGVIIDVEDGRATHIERLRILQKQD